MDSILNLFHQRMFNLEITLQANNQISHHSQKNPLSSSRTNSNIIQPSLTHEFLPNNTNLSISQMKTRTYEYLAIFQSAFDQLNILSIDTSISNSSNESNSNCSSIALNLAGIFIMKDDEKFQYEIEYFSQMLLSLFRNLLVDSSTIEHEQHSKQILTLQIRLNESQEKISQLSLAKQHFPNEKSEQITQLNTIQSQLKDRLMEENSRSKIALRYCQNWKTNHIYQWIQMLLQNEDLLQKTIHQYELDLQQTELVHHKTIQMLIEQKNDIQSKANQWYEYYQNESQRFERELTDFRWQYNQLKARREEMTNEYNRMKTIVDEYNQMKINEKFKLEKQKQEEEAIKILQTWWRGIINRQKKEKKKKKKKKKKVSI